MDKRRATDAEREASRWIARLEASDVSLDDHQRFRAWLEACPENRTAYEALSRTWDLLDTLKFHTPATAPADTAAAPSRRFFLASAIGASVTAAVGVSTWLLASGSSQAAAFETPVGGRRVVPLEDGSRIEMNASSRIVVRYGASRRRVALEQGEALFEVAPDTARPFLIETRFGDLRVTGTSLSVKLTATFARATVLEGSVEVLRPRSPSLTASAHEEVSLANDSTKAAIEAPVIERRLAWRRGMLAFDGETLREAAADVAAQTGVRFVFADEDTAALRVGGYIDAQDQEAFLALLRDNLGVSTRQNDDGSIVLDR